MPATCAMTWFSRETYEPLSELPLVGLQSPKPHRVVPNTRVRARAIIRVRVLVRLGLGLVLGIGLGLGLGLRLR